MTPRTTTPTTHPLLTSRDLEQMLSFSYQTVCSWTKAGKIPALRLPNDAYRYRPAEIHAWMAERSTT